MKYLDFVYAGNVLGAPKNRRFSKNAILLPKPSEIKASNNVLYERSRQPPKSRCFWRPELKNLHFQHISPLSELKNSVHHYKKSKVHMPPPQKLASKIVKPSVKIFTLNIFLRFQFSSFVGRFRHQTKIYGVSLNWLTHGIATVLKSNLRHPLST